MKKQSASWLAIFAGRILMRGCRVEQCVCDECHLRALCKCASQDMTAANKIEERVWIALGVCAAVGIVAAFWFHRA